MTSESWVPNAALRRRGVYAAFALTTIVIGLFVHLHGAFLSPVARDIIGDALWAAMIVWLVGIMAPRAKLVFRGAAAYAVCVGVEASQAFHSPALDAIRATTLGHLILGSGFDPRDLTAYAAGVGAAMLVEVVARKKLR